MGHISLATIDRYEHESPAFYRYELDLAIRDHRDGLGLPGNAFWRFLERKYDRAPARFDFWHPIAGRLISEAEHLSAPTPPPSLPVCPTPHATPGCVGMCPAGVIAEPASSVLLETTLAVAGAVAIVTRYFRRLSL